MKSLTTLIFALFLTCTGLYANILTVSNNTFSPGVYTSLQTALAAANSGDSIYVEPTPNNYGNITITNKVNLFGGGGVPYTYQINNPTYLTAVTFSAGSDGSQLQGFNVTGGINVNQGINGIVIARNYITSSALDIKGIDTNIAIINNIFNSQNVSITSSYNNDNTVLIANNIFANEYDGYQGGVPVQVNNTNEQQGVQVLNNIMEGYNQESNSSPFFNSVSSATVKNNIFYGIGYSGTFSSGCSNCNFQNNITFSGGGTTQVLPDGNNTGTGNFNDVALSPFVSGPATYTTIPSTTLWNYNWNVISTYATAGTDGTQIGIMGGEYPMPNFETVTRLPQVRQVNINNTSVAPNGTLNVNLIGTTRN